MRAATTAHCHGLTPNPPLRLARLLHTRLCRATTTPHCHGLMTHPTLRLARLLQARRRTRVSRAFGGLRAELSRANCSMARPLASCAFSAA